MKWLPHIKSVVKEKTLTEAILLWKTSHELPHFNYRYEHVKAVVNLALRLAKDTGADEDVVRAAAWLHDIGKSDDGGSTCQGHGERGANLAAEILAETDFPKDKIEAVQDSISKHVGLYKDHSIEPLEAAILWDADKLSKLGATLVATTGAHMPAYELNKNQQTLTIRRMIELNSEWLEVSHKIVESFNLEISKKIGEKRLEEMKRFFNQLENEVNGLL